MTTTTKRRLTRIVSEVNLWSSSSLPLSSSLSATLSLSLPLLCVGFWSHPEGQPPHSHRSVQGGVVGRGARTYTYSYVCVYAVGKTTRRRQTETTWVVVVVDVRGGLCCASLPTLQRGKRTVVRVPTTRTYCAAVVFSSTTQKCLGSLGLSWWPPPPASNTFKRYSPQERRTEKLFNKCHSLSASSSFTVIVVIQHIMYPTCR